MPLPITSFKTTKQFKKEIMKFFRKHRNRFETISHFIRVCISAYMDKTNKEEALENEIINKCNLQPLNDPEEKWKPKHLTLLPFCVLIAMN